MGLKLPEWDPMKIGQMIVVALTILAVLTLFINFKAINAASTCQGSAVCNALSTETTCSANDACTWSGPSYIKDFDENTVMRGFMYLIIAGAVYFAWYLVLRTSYERWDKNFFITLVVAGIVIYFLYTKILQPTLCVEDSKCLLPSLKFAAYNIQSMMPPAVNSVVGLLP